MVQVWTGAGISRESTDLTPTEARALAGVLVAVAGDVEARAPADLRAAILRGASDEEREPMREVLRASLPTVDHETGRCVSCGYDVVGLGPTARS